MYRTYCQGCAALWRASQHIVANLDLKDVEKDIHGGLMALTPNDIFERLRELQYHMNQTLLKNLIDTEMMVFKGEYSHPSSSGSGQTMSVGGYQLSLIQRNLTTGDVKVDTRSMSLNWQVIRDIAKEHRQIREKDITCGDEKCKKCPSPLYHDILQVGQESKEKLRGRSPECER